MATTNLTTQFISASFQNLLQISSSNNIFDGLGVQVNNLTVTASYVINAQTASYVQQSISASFTVSASFAATASYVTNAVSASYATNAVSASYATNAVSASYAATASYSKTLGASLTNAVPGKLKLIASDGTELIEISAFAANSAITSQTASYSTTLGATISNFTSDVVSFASMQLKNSDGNTISSTGHFSASYAYTASYALNAGGASGSIPGGSNTQLQFNNAGVFGGTDTASTKYQFTGSLVISGSISGSANTIIDFSNLGNGTAGKLVIPTSAPMSPVHGTMWMDAPGAGNVTLYIYNGNIPGYRTVTLT